MALALGGMRRRLGPGVRCLGGGAPGPGPVQVLGWGHGPPVRLPRRATRPRRLPPAGRHAAAVVDRRRRRGTPHPGPAGARPVVVPTGGRPSDGAGPRRRGGRPIARHLHPVRGRGRATVDRDRARAGVLGVGRPGPVGGDGGRGPDLGQRPGRRGLPAGGHLSQRRRGGAAPAAGPSGIPGRPLPGPARSCRPRCGTCRRGRGSPGRSSSSRARWARSRTGWATPARSASARPSSGSMAAAPRRAGPARTSRTDFANDARRAAASRPGRSARRPRRGGMTVRPHGPELSAGAQRWSSASTALAMTRWPCSSGCSPSSASSRVGSTLPSALNAA